jgi:uncharacterized membrane protein YhaH (DUF805 family)
MITPSQISRLEKLAELKQKGALTEEEFNKLKGDILAEGVGHGTQIPRVLDRGSLPDIVNDRTNPLYWASLPIVRYVDFAGRSQRKEYWLYTAGMAAVYITLIFLLFAGISTNIYDQNEYGGIFYLSFLLITVFSAAILIPTVAVQVRRFHDQDLSGWFALLNFIPYIGGLVVMVMMCLPGTDGPNRFGSNPKNVDDGGTALGITS